MSRLTESLKDIKNDPPPPLKLTPEEREAQAKRIDELHERVKSWIESVGGTYDESL
jgi:hypothetical protein